GWRGSAVTAAVSRGPLTSMERRLGRRGRVVMDDEFVRVEVAMVSWSCWRCRRGASAAVGMLVPGVGWVAVGELLCEALGDEASAGWREAAGLGVVKPRWSKTAGRS